MEGQMEGEMETQFYMSKIASFLDDEGRLTQYPARVKRQIFTLYYLASKFEPGKRYTEKEVNQILQEWHTFDDWATLRRDLCDRCFLDRKADGSEYWLQECQPTLESLGIV